MASAKKGPAVLFDPKWIDLAASRCWWSGPVA